jgi:hypothetical protein
MQKAAGLSSGPFSLVDVESSVEQQFEAMIAADSSRFPTIEGCTI